eukprot:scaffold323766_cov33-Tisochrysis_lutea.AAC.1
MRAPACRVSVTEDKRRVSSRVTGERRERVDWGGALPTITSDQGVRRSQQLTVGMNLRIRARYTLSNHSQKRCARSQVR